MNDIELLKKENDELRLTINGSVLQIQAMQLQINAMKIGQKVLDGAIQTKSISNSEWREKYMREVEGLNNEGDPIGGDPPSGLRHAIEYFKAENAAQQKKIIELENQISSQMNFGELMIIDSDGDVVGDETGRLVAKFSHWNEAESFCEAANFKYLKTNKG